MHVLLAAEVAQPDVELLWKLLENQPGSEIDDYTRWRLLEGLDDIGPTLRHEAEITAFEAARPARMPVTSSRSAGAIE